MSDRDGNSFVWFLAGLGLGALAGVLYAPREARRASNCAHAPRKAASTFEIGPKRQRTRRRSGPIVAATQ
jgi:hypothetical protein